MLSGYLAPSISYAISTPSGKLGTLTENGFEVVDAGIKVFEKKAKESSPEVTAVSSDAMPVS